MVILLGLIFLLDRSTQDQTMKISFIFFRALFYLICIYKVQANFWSCLNRLEKGFNHPGHVSHSEGIRRDLSVWLLGHVARSEGVPKGSLGVGLGHVARSEGGSEGGLSGWLSGHEAYPEDIRRDSGRWMGDRRLGWIG